jgi:hypothetical protein
VTGPLEVAVFIAAMIVAIIFTSWLLDKLGF